METINVTISDKNWHDVEELTGIDFSVNDSYTITFKNCFKGEVCKSNVIPTENFIGHSVKNDENFLYEHKEQLKLFVKIYPLLKEQKCVLIVS